MSAWQEDDYVNAVAGSTFEGPPIPLLPRFTRFDFPVQALPPTYAEMVKAVAEATQTDPAMAGTTVLTVLAAAAGGCVEVEVRAGWREPLCLFTATIAKPGERKSAVQAILTEPLVGAEEVLAAETSTARIEAETLRAVATKDAERARAAASSAEAGAKKDKAQADAVSAALAAEAIVVPPITRLFADDVTPEAAASLMAEQQRLAVISAEGGVLDTLAGRYSSGIPNLDLFLKGHAGDRLRIDRKGRDPEYVKRPALTVGLMIQPSVLEAIGRNKQFRGRGLLARFLYAAPVSYVGQRNSRAEPVPAEVGQAYSEHLHNLVVDLAGWCGGPVAITLTEAAQEAVVRILDATEAELADNGVLAGLRDWGSKYVGAVMRIAGLLHLARHGANGVRQSIDTAEIVAAVKVATYYKSHAVQAFTVMQTDETTAAALWTLDRILATHEEELSERDIHRETRSRFHTVTELRPVIANLVDHGLLARLPEPEHRGPGRPKSPRFAVHPHAHEYGTQRTQHTDSGSASSVHSVPTSPTHD